MTRQTLPNADSCLCADEPQGSVGGPCSKQHDGDSVEPIEPRVGFHVDTSRCAEKEKS